MTNDSWQLTWDLERLERAATTVDLKLTLCTLTPDQAACLDRVIARLNAVAQKRKPVLMEAAE